MQRNVELEATIVAKYAAVSPVLNERSRRLWAAAESLAIGYGGDALVSSATGLARETIRNGRREIAQGGAATDRIRGPGAGRPRLEQNQPGLLAALEALVDPLPRGDPTSPLRWTCKSRAKLAGALTQQGWRVSSTTVGRLLRQLGYRLQSARKRQEGASHPDRNAQFEHINATADGFLAAGQPVISVDTKKKELVGNFKNGGREWQPKGTPPAVLVHDFPTDAEGKAIPYGVYDMARNEAWVSVGWDHDTPAFAVASIRHWWHQMGCGAYPEATTLFITADAGGSNGYRLRAWKHELQQLADETAPSGGRGARGLPRGRGSAGFDLLPHVPGDGDHGVSVERGDARTRAADRRARVAEDDEALRPDGRHDHRRRDRAHRDLDLGPAATAIRNAWERRSTFNEGRGVNPGDTFDVIRVRRPARHAQRRPGREPRRHPRRPPSG